MSDLRKILGLGENTTIYDINDVLKTKTYEELNQLRKNYNIIHPDDKINIVEDLHYRRVNGKLALNELVVYYNELYSNRQDFNARVKKEQIKFAQDFLDYGVKIYYDGILSSFIAIVYSFICGHTPPPRIFGITSSLEPICAISPFFSRTILSAISRILS